MMIARLIQTALITISSGACLTQAPTFNNDEKVDLTNDSEPTKTYEINLNNNEFLVANNYMKDDETTFVIGQESNDKTTKEYISYYKEYKVIDNTITNGDKNRYTIKVRQVISQVEIPQNFQTTTNGEGSIGFIIENTTYIAIWGQYGRNAKVKYEMGATAMSELNSLSQTLDERVVIDKDLSTDIYAYAGDNNGNNSNQYNEVINRLATSNIYANSYTIPSANYNNMTPTSSNTRGEYDLAEGYGYEIWDENQSVYSSKTYDFAYSGTMAIMNHSYGGIQTDNFQMRSADLETLTSDEYLYYINIQQKKITIYEYDDPVIPDSESSETSESSGSSGTTINYEYIDIPALMYSIIAMPFTFISQAFNLTLFPNTPWEVNISYIMQLIIIVLITMFIIRLIMRGGGS